MQQIRFHTREEERNKYGAKKFFENETFGEYTESSATYI